MYGHGAFIPLESRRTPRRSRGQPRTMKLTKTCNDDGGRVITLSAIVTSARMAGVINYSPKYRNFYAENFAELHQEGNIILKKNHHNKKIL